MAQECSRSAERCLVVHLARCTVRGLPGRPRAEHVPGSLQCIDIAHPCRPLIVRVGVSPLVTPPEQPRGNTHYACRCQEACSGSASIRADALDELFFGEVCQALLRRRRRVDVVSRPRARQRTACPDRATRRSCQEQPPAPPDRGLRPQRRAALGELHLDQGQKLLCLLSAAGKRHHSQPSLSRERSASDSPPRPAASHIRVARPTATGVRAPTGHRHPRASPCRIPPSSGRMGYPSGR